MREHDVPDRRPKPGHHRQARQQRVDVPSRSQREHNPDDAEPEHRPEHPVRRQARPSQSHPDEGQQREGAQQHHEQLALAETTYRYDAAADRFLVAEKLQIPGRSVILELIQGILSFFHRDQPGSLEVRTGSVSAIVKGTEFVFAAPPAGPPSLTLKIGRAHV